MNAECGMQIADWAVPTLPAPFYADDLITLYHADAPQLLPLLPTHDVLLTDPPYGISVAANGVVCSRPPEKSKRTGFKIAKMTEHKPVIWDAAPPPRWLLEMAMAKARWQIIWGGAYMGRMPRATCSLVWDKRNDGMAFSQAEIAWTNLPSKATRLFRWRWQGALQEDIKNKEMRVHPTQKPVPLMEWCLSFTPKARTVLDPFAGSGSALVAAKRLGLRAVGIERDAGYCAAAAQRLRETNPGESNSQ